MTLVTRCRGSYVLVYYAAREAREIFLDGH